jgi:hypothetical protein
MHLTRVFPAIAEAAYLGKLATRNPHTQVNTKTDWELAMLEFVVMGDLHQLQR